MFLPQDTMKHLVAILFFVVGAVVPAWCATVFIEAETFHSSGGWEVVSGPETRDASGFKTLSGSKGAADGSATTTVRIKTWKYFETHLPEGDVTLRLSKRIPSILATASGPLPAVGQQRIRQTLLPPSQRSEP
jgi:hypothetical protein